MGMSNRGAEGAGARRDEARDRRAGGGQRIHFEALVAVGDLWQDARWCVASGESGVACAWDDAPLLR